MTNNLINHNIYSLSRSGTHAIIYWMIHNIVNHIDHIGSGIYIDKEKSVCFINNTNIQTKLLKENFCTDYFKYVFLSYEDTLFTDNTSIIILRDFLNLVCSRYEKYNKNKHNICLNNMYICDIYYLIHVWKQHTKSPKRTIIYNQWLTSKKYRDTISSTIVKIPNLVDNISYIPDIGQGSSFSVKNCVNKNSYLKRYELVKLPEHIKKIILNDQELLDINHEIFKINIKKILC